MNDPTSHARHLVEIATSDTGTYEETMQAAEPLLASLAEAQDLDVVLRTIAPGLDAEDAERAGIAAIIVGTLIERGADASLVGDAMVTRFQAIAELAEQYLDRCREYFHTEIVGDDGCTVCAPGDDEKEIMLPHVRHAVRDSMPEGEAAWIALDLFCRPVVSVLSRLPHLRREVASDPAIAYRCGILAQHQAGPYYVFALLSVLEGERVVVLDPADRQGFEFELDGIADNFQLHLLLADALIGGGHCDGEAPAADVVAAMRGEEVQVEEEFVTARWNLFQWTGLRPDGTLPDGYFDTGAEHWVWNEGVPADISEFEGRRVILLAPTPYVRSWPPKRLFDDLPASLELRRQLDDAEVDDWLARLSAASAERRQPSAG